MRKNIIWLVTIILSVTLIGLIVVQGYWIKNAMEINEKQFQQIVKQGLVDVVKEIEKREMVYQVINEVDPYQRVSTDAASINYHFNQLSQNKYSVRSINLDKEFFEINALDSIKFDASLEVLGQSGIQLNTKSNFILNDAGKELLKKKYNFDDRLTAKFSDRKVFVENIVNKLIQIDVELEERIDLETINKIIIDEFDEKGINLDYEYAILANKIDTVYVSNKFSPRVRAQIYSEKLFPNDVVSKENYISIYFPNEKRYVFKSTGFMAANSMILTIIVILGFSLSIHIMFKQKKLSSIKNDFVNNMTHELKTPISTISLASQMMKDKSIPMESKNVDYISNVIDEESKRLSYQVEKVLKTALFEQGKIKLNRKKLDIHIMIENVIKNFDIQLQNRKGHLDKSLDAKDSFAYLDEIHFTNILFNLLDNAVKYSKDIPEVKITTQSINGGIQISVADKGIGIRRQDQKKVFDQFYRVPTGNRHDVKGFGLGLNYVKKIVEEHGGEINLESEYKEGSTFEIYIPTNYIPDGKQKS